MKPSSTLEQARAKLDVRQRPRYADTAPDQFSLWTEPKRGIPNDLARCALFTCTNPSEPRAEYRNELLVSVRGFELTYSGVELRQDDLDLWLQIAHMARPKGGGRFHEVEITSYGLLMAMGKTDGQKNYTTQRESIDRLNRAHITVVRDERKGFQGHLLAWVNWADQPGGKDRRAWRLTLHEDAINLFRPDGFTLLDWQLRKELKPLEKWVHAFYSTHREPVPYSVKTLLELCGSKSRVLYSFRAKLKKAMEELRAREFLLSWEIDPATDAVHVRRNPAKTYG
jgi:hypothetical protein